MNIKISKALFESAQLCRARNDVRNYLCGVAILPDLRIAATNGHVLFVGDKVDCSNPIRETVILDVQKSPTQRYDHVVINTKTLVATFRDKLNSSVGLSLVKVVKGSFPEFDQLFTDIKPTGCNRIGFSGEYLSLAGKISNLFGGSGFSFTLHGWDKAASGKITDYTSNGKFVVMPMRIE